MAVFVQKLTSFVPSPFPPAQGQGPQGLPAGASGANHLLDSTLAGGNFPKPCGINWVEMDKPLKKYIYEHERDLV